MIMQKIRTSIIVILAILNFICPITMYFLSKLDTNNYDYDDNTFEYNPINHHYAFQNRNNITNSYYRNKYNDDYYNKENLITSTLYLGCLLTLNTLCLFFWLILISSFCVGETECCDCCYGNNSNCCNCDCSSYHCDCSGSNNECGKFALVLMIFACIIVIVYYSLKCCGKHIARYISIISTIFINACIFVVSLLVLSDRNYDQVLRILIVSGFSIFVNSLSVILPNIKSCKKFRFRNRLPSSDIIDYNRNQLQISQINNNVIIQNSMNNNNNNNNTPVPVNYMKPQDDKDYNIYAIPVPNINTERQNQNNENISNNISNNNDNNADNQIVEDVNQDMGIAPLPAFEMQTKK